MDVGSFTGTCTTGSTGGGGTVTSITEDVNLFPEVLVNGVASYTITGSGTFAWSKVVQAPNTVWAGPTTAPSAVPVFRALVPADGNGAFWTITGNTGTVPGTNWIGTNDNQSWVWKTNNVERARLLNTGNLGIGTTTAGRLLDVGPTTANLLNGGSGAIRGGVQDSGMSGGAVYNVKAYGATGDGTTDDTTAVTRAFQQAIADWGTKANGVPSWGATVYFPPGTYKCDAIRPSAATITVPINVLGAGVGVSVIKFITTDNVGRGLEYNLLSPAAFEANPAGLFHGPRIENLTFESAAGNRPEFHVLVNVALGSTKPIEGTVVKNCEFNNAYVGLGLYETAATEVYRVTTRPGNLNQEIVFHNSTYYDSGDSFVTECDFQSRLMTSGSPNTAQIEWFGSNGLRIEDNKFNGSAAAGDGPYSHIHFKGDAAVDTGSPSEIVILGNSFEGSDYYSILMDGKMGDGGRCIIEGNQFDDANKAIGGERISFQPSATAAAIIFGWQISNNNFHREATGTAHNFIELLPTGGVTLTRFEIVGNQFRTEKNTDIAIYANAACSNVHIGDNEYDNFIQPVNTTTATGEGVTLYQSGAFGNFIDCYNPQKTGANLRFRVDYNGQSFIRFANIGGRPPVDATVFAATVAIDETNYQASQNVVSAYSPRTTGSFLLMRNDTTTLTGNFITVLANETSGGVAGTGGFTGYVLQYANAAVNKFIIDYHPQIISAQMAAPGAYGAGYGQLYFDSADQKWHVVDGAGNHAI